MHAAICCYSNRCLVRILGHVAGMYIMQFMRGCQSNVWGDTGVICCCCLGSVMSIAWGQNLQMVWSGVPYSSRRTQHHGRVLFEKCAGFQILDPAYNFFTRFEQRFSQTDPPSYPPPRYFISHSSKKATGVKHKWIKCQMSPLLNHYI